MVERVEHDGIGMLVGRFVEGFLPHVGTDRPEVPDGILLEEFTRSSAIADKVMPEHRREVMLLRGEVCTLNAIECAVQVCRKPVCSRDRRGLRDIRFLDTQADIRILGICLEDFLELRAGAVEFTPLQEGKPERLAQREVLGVAIHERQQDIYRHLGAVTRCEVHRRASTRRGLFTEGRLRFGCLAVIRVECEHALVYLVGGIKVPAVFGKVALQQMKFHVHRELRERVFHEGRATVQQALVVIEARHNLVGPRVSARRKAYRRAAFTRCLRQPAFLEQEPCKPQSRIVKCRGLLHRNLRELHGKRRVRQAVGKPTLDIACGTTIHEPVLEQVGKLLHAEVFAVGERVHFEQSIKFFPLDPQHVRVNHDDGFKNLNSRRVVAPAGKFHRASQFGLRLYRERRQSQVEVGRIATHDRGTCRQPERHGLDRDTRRAKFLI